MFNAKKVRQLFSTRNLNKDNRVMYSSNSRQMAEQLLVLKQVNDKILKRGKESEPTYIRGSFDSTATSR